MNKTSKLQKTIINEAPDYFLNNKGEVVNGKSNKVIAAKDGKVRLQVDGKRQSFTVESLKESNKFKAAKITKSPVKSPASKDDKAPAKKEKKALKKIEKGVYPYKIKNQKEITAAKKAVKIGDVVKYVDYKTKKVVKGTAVSHSKYSDGYPGLRIKTIVKKGEKSVSKIVSYLKLK